MAKWLSQGTHWPLNHQALANHYATKPLNHSTMLYSVLAWLERSALGHAMRESGAWTYPLVNLTHILGIALLFGSVVVLDLRLLGVGRRSRPLAPIADAASPVAAIGFTIAAATGLGLLATKATEYAGNPFLYIKFVAIALGFANAVAVRRSAEWRARYVPELSAAEKRRLAWMGAMSLVAWLTAVSAGRLIAYW